MFYFKSITFICGKNCEYSYNEIDLVIADPNPNGMNNLIFTYLKNRTKIENKSLIKHTRNIEIYSTIS